MADPRCVEHRRVDPTASAVTVPSAPTVTGVTAAPHQSNAARCCHSDTGERRLGRPGGRRGKVDRLVVDEVAVRTDLEGRSSDGDGCLAVCGDRAVGTLDEGNRRAPVRRRAVMGDDSRRVRHDPPAGGEIALGRQPTGKPLQDATLDGEQLHGGRVRLRRVAWAMPPGPGGKPDRVRWTLPPSATDVGVADTTWMLGRTVTGVHAKAPISKLVALLSKYPIAHASGAVSHRTVRLLSTVTNVSSTMTWTSAGAVSTNGLM